MQKGGTWLSQIFMVILNVERFLYIIAKFTEKEKKRSEKLWPTWCDKYHL